MFPKDIPYEDQMITRVAALYARGAEKYGARNYENSKTEDSLAHHEDSLMRHVIAFLLGTDDGEDHAAAAIWNAIAVDLTRRNIKKQRKSSQQEIAPEITVTTTGQDPNLLRWNHAELREGQH